MVGDAANGDRISTYIIDDSSDIRKDLLEVFLADGYTRTLDMEDDVDVEFCVGVCHSLLFYLSCRDSRRLFISLSPLRGSAQSRRDGISICRRRKSLLSVQEARFLLSVQETRLACFKSSLRFRFHYNPTADDIRFRLMVNHTKLSRCYT